MKHSGFLCEFTLIFWLYIFTLSDGKSQGFPGDEGERILYGKEAKDGQFPFAVSLHFNDEFICTATLVSPYTVLTAAHCVTDKNGAKLRPWSFHGFVGTINQNGEGGLKILFSNVTEHPEYDSSNFQNDVAFLKTSSPVEYTDNIQSVCLNRSLTNLMDTATVAGWGKYMRLGGSSSVLRYNRGQRLTSETSCRLNYLFRLNYTTQLCANGGFMSSGPCNGDSGGPLLCYTDAGDKVQCGITSYGKKFICDFPRLAKIVYTRISAFIDWLKMASNDTSMCVL